MTKEEIENHDAFKVIGKQSPAGRYEILFGSMRSFLEEQFGVKITEAPFTYLSEKKENEICISCQADNGNMVMAVLKING